MYSIRQRTKVIELTFGERNMCVHLSDIFESLRVRLGPQGRGHLRHLIQERTLRQLNRVDPFGTHSRFTDKAYRYGIRGVLRCYTAVRKGLRHVLRLMHARFRGKLLEIKVESLW